MRSVLTLSALVITSLFPTPLSHAARQESPAQKLARARKWIVVNYGTFDSSTRALSPGFDAILKRYFLDRRAILESEQGLIEILLKGMPGTDFEGGLTTRDPAQKFKELKEFLATKLPGVAAKPTFRSGERTTPGGKKLGFVEMSVSGRRRTVVEILTAPANLTLSSRAETVSSGMSALHGIDPLWWTRLAVGQVRGQYVVASPKAPRGYVITADSEFAKAWQLSREGLARQLIRTIRRTFDPNPAVAFRDPSGKKPADEMRDEAIAARQKGDELSKKYPDQAESYYRKAIEADPSYALPYERLADLYLSLQKTDQAKRILQEGISTPEVPAEQKQVLQSRLSAIG